MKSIHTLILDVYELLQRKDGWLNADLSRELSTQVASRMAKQFELRTKAPELYIGSLGPRCPKALWASIHCPEEAEQLPPWAVNKFSYGHMLEAWLIFLAKASGHTVTGEQDAIYADGVKGRRDCVIDGYIVDVKSASSPAFLKFKEKSIEKNDSFGYLDQLDGYLLASAEDDLVQVKDTGYLWAVDKQLGHMVLYEHRHRPKSIRDRIRRYKEIVSLAEPPTCTCGTVPDGKSGNIRLDTRASYSPFKYYCRPKLRTFLYSDGPHYLTNVERLPNVPEVDRYGRQVYSHS